MCAILSVFVSTVRSMFDPTCRFCKSKLYYDRQSVGESILASGTHLGPETNFSPSLFDYLYTVSGLLMWGALSDEKSGL
jgi:hypothetical protein